MFCLLLFPGNLAFPLHVRLLWVLNGFQTEYTHLYLVELLVCLVQLRPVHILGLASKENMDSTEMSVHQISSGKAKEH
ncbi:hypothetical protein V6N12_030579 [Hibiscus sabdariffa]|uniref:Uncharacterized protein n=1 Tax=Hibiscus sabdariffa TaxID=183260 RepID=A0ABR1ZXP5_9ROSI